MTFIITMRYFNYSKETERKNHMQMNSNNHSHILAFVSMNTQFHKIKIIGRHNILFCSLYFPAGKL